MFQDETNDVIAELRNDISKLRERIASTSEPNRDDVLKMEVSTIFFEINMDWCSGHKMD